MEQRRITSADFVSPGEALVPDTILSPDDPHFVATRQPELANFLHSHIELRKQEKIEPIDVTIIREQKYDVIKKP